MEGKKRHYEKFCGPALEVAGAANRYFHKVYDADNQVFNPKKEHQRKDRPLPNDYRVNRKKIGQKERNYGQPGVIVPRYFNFALFGPPRVLNLLHRFVIRLKPSVRLRLAQKRHARK